MKIFFPFLLLTLLFAGCGNEKKPQKSSEVKQEATQLYTAKTFTVKVYYEAGAEPYAGEVGTQTGVKYWDILQKNLESLFQSSVNIPVIVVPKELTEMIQIPSANKDKWTAQDIVDLAKTVHAPAAEGETIFSLFFVKGHYAESDKVIGFHISASTTMAVFKDVVKGSYGGELEIVPKYVEQATIVHEMGHALGLVNNGLEMVTPHEDKDHRAHCSNQDCVMYFSNEGAQDMIKFAGKVMAGQSVVMFDKQCLDDSRSVKLK